MSYYNIYKDILKEISFKSTSFRNNFDILNDNDNIITEIEGIISLLRNDEGKMPKQIGEFGISVWDLRMVSLNNVDIIKLLEYYNTNNVYCDFLNLLNNKKIDISQYNKIVFIHSIYVIDEFKKHGISEEFVEYVYREYYSSDNLILFYVKPIQLNTIEYDVYVENTAINVKDYINDEPVQIPTKEYYSFNKLLNLDEEISTYKLFAKASKLGLDRLDETYIFKFNEMKVMNNIVDKYNNIK